MKSQSKHQLEYLRETPEIVATGTYGALILACLSIAGTAFLLGLFAIFGARTWTSRMVAYLHLVLLVGLVAASLSWHWASTVARRPVVETVFNAVARTLSGGLIIVFCFSCVLYLFDRPWVAALAVAITVGAMSLRLRRGEALNPK